MMCLDCVADSAGYYAGSTLEAMGDGLAYIAPSIIYGSQLTSVVTFTTTVVSGVGEFLGVTNHRQTEMNLLGAFFSMLTIFVGLGMNETAGKVHALGSCLKDQKRSLFKGC